MNKRTKMDERETLEELKIFRACYLFETIMIILLFFTQILGLSINIIDALFIIIATSGLLFLILKAINK